MVAEDLSTITVGQLSKLEVGPDERAYLMDRVQRGKKLDKNEAYKVCAILLQIIERDEGGRSDATLFLAAFSARYGIEIKQ